MPENEMKINSAWFHIHQLWKVIRITEAEIAWCHRVLEAADGDGELLFNTVSTWNDENSSRDGCQ